MLGCRAKDPLYSVTFISIAPKARFNLGLESNRGGQ